MAFDTMLTSGWNDFTKFLNPQMPADFSSSNTGPQFDQDGNFTGTNQAPTVTNTGKQFQNMGLMMTVMGGVNSAIGGYFAAKTQQYQDKSQAVSLGYQADMAAINARSAEYSAQSTLEAGKSQIANMTMAAGQQKASATATMAAHGIRLGVGSAADISASQDIVKEINMYTIDANATRAAAQDRTQATNYGNQSLMDRTSAANLYKSADSISPFSAMTSSLLTTASSVGQQWNSSRQAKMMFAYYGGS